VAQAGVSLSSAEVNHLTLTLTANTHVVRIDFAEFRIRELSVFICSTRHVKQQTHYSHPSQGSDPSACDVIALIRSMT
jgi:hypothetical protein